jgi:hypothetical protein
MAIKEKKIVGWREYVDLPEWGIHGIRAKIDTGARTSSLHVEDIVELSNGRIGFYVVVSLRPKKRRYVIANIIRRGNVKSSVGQKTRRWFVRTNFCLGQHQKDIVINLVGRDTMSFRMLIGRKAIEKVFLVDAGHSFLVQKINKRKGTRA